MHFSFLSVSLFFPLFKSPSDILTDGGVRLPFPGGKKARRPLRVEDVSVQGSSHASNAFYEGLRNILIAK